MLYSQTENKTKSVLHQFFLLEKFVTSEVNFRGESVAEM
jgi:hypothetical protein